MTTTRVDERQEDFIAQLLRYINEGRPDIAIERLESMSDKGNRFEALYGLLDAADLRSNSWQLKLNLGVLNSLALAHNLARDLAHARGLNRNLARDLAFARNLTNTLSRALSRTVDPNLAHALAFITARKHTFEIDRVLNVALDFDLDQPLDGALASDLDRVLIRALDFARDLARDLAHTRDISYIIQDFEAVTQVIIHLIGYDIIRDELSNEIQTRYHNRLAVIYDECEHLKQRETSPVLDVIAQVIWDEMQNYPILITLQGVNEINADVLSEQIAPFMQAIQGFQEVHAAITRAEFVRPRIVHILNEVPKIEIIGAEGILRFFYEVLNKTKRELDLSEQREKINQTKAASDLTQEDIKDRQLDRMLKIIEFQQAILPKYLEIADTYLRQNYPQLTDVQRLEHVPRIADSLMQADRTRLALRFGWHDVPRPPSLPEM